MGVKLYAERRYSAKDMFNTTDDDLMRCNTENAIKVIGFQTDKDSEKCTHVKLLNTKSTSAKVKSFILSTFGTYMVKNAGSAWQKQIQHLVQRKQLAPRVIKQELVLILR